MVSQFGSLGYTIMGKTADFVYVCVCVCVCVCEIYFRKYYRAEILLLMLI